MAGGRGDIVFEIGGNTSSLVSAGAKGVSALAVMEKAAKATEVQMRNLERSSTAFQKAVGNATGLDKVAKSARESALAFEKLAKAQDDMAGLRAQIDPLYAASMRYAEALQKVDDALEAGAISTAQHADMTKKLAASMLEVNPAASGSGEAVGKFGMIANQVGFQIQDVFVSGPMVGWFKAVAQQAPQAAGAFSVLGGTLGTVIPWLGTGVAVGAALIPILTGMGAETRTFSEALAEAEARIASINANAKMFSADGLNAMKEKYGEVSLELIRFLDLQAQADQRKAFAGTKEALGTLFSDMETWTSAWSGTLENVLGQLEAKFGATREQALGLYNALLQAKNAKTFEEQLAAVTRLRERILTVTGGIKNMTDEQFLFYEKVRDSEDALRQLAAAAPKAGWLGAAIAQAEELGGKLWDAVRAKAALADTGPGMTMGNGEWAKNNLGFTLPGKELLGLPEDDKGRKGGGGGGSKDTTKSDLENLQNQLLSEAELQMQAYEEQQILLEQALEKKLLTQQEYNELMQAAQRDHQGKMTEIDVWQYGDGLAKAETFLGGMADAFQSGNERMQRIGQVFGAAEALVNAWRAYSQTMADPRLPFVAKIPAAMSVLAAGMKAVQAIKGGGSSSGARAPAASAAAAAAPSPAQVNIQWNGAMTAESMGSLTQKLNNEYKQGYRLNFVMG